MSEQAKKPTVLIVLDGFGYRELKEFGDNKINVIKAIREVVSGLGLKEAKDLVESAPTKVKEGIAKAEAETIAAKLKDAGAVVEIA